MIWSVIIYALILLALAWPFGWLAMLLVTVAFSVGIGVGAAWEDEQRSQGDTVAAPPKRRHAWLQNTTHVATRNGGT
jgi:hypothetical protein